MSNLLWVLLSWLAAVSWGLPQHSGGERLTEPDDVDPGEPLFLTPYLERGDVAEARKLARQPAMNDSLQFESYSGFFTINKTYNSNHFFWYIPSMSSDKNKDPLLLCLSGSLGGSSLVELFIENGPLAVKKWQFVRREYHWALNHHVIYIDSPVGAGFSFTQHEAGYCSDETQIGEQLYTTLTQFLQLFPELQQNDFFITGQGYTGKFAPALGHIIHNKNPSAEIKVNLKGLVIGGAWINPITQINFIGQPGPQNYTNIKMQALQLPTDSITKKRKCVPFCLDSGTVGTDSKYATVLRTNAVRKAIHVGDLKYFEINCTTYGYLDHDYCKTMAHWLAELLDHYSVTLYGSELDKFTRYVGIVDFLRNHFNFTGADEYRNAKQYSWYVDGDLAGCVRRARLLTDVYFLDASHFVCRDQPKRAWDMITRITHGQGFDQKEACPVTPPSA